MDEWDWDWKCDCDRGCPRIGVVLAYRLIRVVRLCMLLTWVILAALDGRRGQSQHRRTGGQVGPLLGLERRSE